MRATSYPHTKGIALSATFVALISVSALISIPINPITPVPITLQVFIVYLVAAVLGPIYGAFSLLIYLLVGAAGLPVYAGATSGIAVLLGPNGGYLFAFPLAALVGGLVSNRRATSRRNDMLRVSVSTLMVLLIIYVFGVVWLSQYLHISIYTATLLGAAPFVPLDILKAIVAVPIALRLRWSFLSLPVNSTLAKAQNTKKS